MPPPNIAWHLERLMEAATELGSDVTFLLKEGEDDSGASTLSFHAHSLVLFARAPALLKEAQAQAAATSKKKTKKKVLWIEGIKAVVFKSLLHFVYTDELPPLDDLVVRATPGSSSVPPATSWTRMAGDLLAAADRYQRWWRG